MLDSLRGRSQLTPTPSGDAALKAAGEDNTMNQFA